MTGQIEIPFAIGEPVWWIGYAYKEEWIECPECAGTKALTFTQGNGTQVSIGCRCCTLGFDDPSGTVKRVVHEHAPTPFTPRRVDISGGEIRYSESGPTEACFRVASVDDLYSDREACAERCAALNAELNENDAKQIIRNMESKRKGMAWSVHYWGRQVKQLERDLAAARERLSQSKDRRKDKADSERGDR